MPLAMLLAWFPVSLVQQAAPEDIFVEAESAANHTFSHVGDFPDIVSGGRILRLWEGNDAPADGYWVDLPFALPSDDEYHIWLAASLPGPTSPFWWRVDDGPWGHITEDALLEVGQTFGVSGVMAWIELTTQRLAAGDHTLRVRVDERRTGLEKAHLLYLDAMLVTPRDVMPRGLVTPADLAKLQPRPAPPVPVQRAGTPGEPMVLGTSVMGHSQNLLVKSLGFSLSQTDSDHLTVNETAPGVWDWSSADAGLEACRKAGLRWQYFPHWHWPPEWYRATDKFVPSTGLRSGRKLACMSLWSPDILPWFDHCYGAMAEHYGSGADPVAAIYVGIHGDFGETIFPMGFHPGERERFGPEGTGVADFWCAAEPDRAAFRAWAHERYDSLEALNQAWGTDFADWNAADYPPAAYSNEADVKSTPEARRRWLDFIDWYFGSMTQFTADVCRIARQHFPEATLVLPVGGGAEALVYGQDNTALPKIAGELGVHIRSTHGGFQPFADNYSTINRRIATASRFYGAPFWMEPPGSISATLEVSRIAESIACGSWGFWDWGSNPVAAADVFREYSAFLTREKPVVDVALLFPTTNYRLNWLNAHSPKLAKMGAEVRDVMDYDIVDEMLIADGALDRYRVLGWLEGDWVEASTLRKLADWIEAGGVVFRVGAEPMRDVSGEAALARELIGISDAAPKPGGGSGPLVVADFAAHLKAVADPAVGATASPLAGGVQMLAQAGGAPVAWAVPRGRGWVIVWAGTCDGDRERRTACELLRDVVYNLSALDPAKADAPELDTAWDSVYTTLLANGEAMVYNDSAEPRTVTVGAETLDLPPKSLRSALVR